jgi:hypothetical protein
VRKPSDLSTNTSRPLLRAMAASRPTPGIN